VQIGFDPPRAAARIAVGPAGKGVVLKSASPDICRVFSSMRFAVMAMTRRGFCRVKNRLARAPGHCLCIREWLFPPKDQRESLGNANSAQNRKTVHNLRANLPAEHFFAGSNSRLTSRTDRQNSPAGQ
jgi:hypothetical protein